MSKLLLFFLISTTTFSQTKTLTGVVSDTLTIPLENANVIAKPFGTNAQLNLPLPVKNNQQPHNQITMKNHVKFMLILQKTPQKPFFFFCIFVPL